MEGVEPYADTVPDDPRWEKWLYETHHPDELHAWAIRLRYFRFCRAIGGHANDGDHLRVALRSETEPALGKLFKDPGVAAIPIGPHTSKPQKDVA